MTTIRIPQSAQVVLVETATPWTLVVATNSPMTDNDLPLVVQHEIVAVTWKLQDGFGALPANYWDWSGIRDSSLAAKRKMAAAIRRVLKAHRITSFKKWSAI